MQHLYIKTKAGPVEIVTDGTYLYSVIFIEEPHKYTNNKLATKLEKELDDYLSGKSKLVSKVKLEGTDFQIKVWEALIKIPYGKTVTYGELAKQIGHPTAYRAVANACARNKLSLYVPCHRVVAVNSLGGYEWGLPLKRWLLEMESNI